MTDLPASIEAYLIEAGFSATEILALKKLLEGEALTLRELAAKTGKSTGVLDLAVKKLLQRRMISRETVNDTPKVLIKSLEAVTAWVKRDTEEKLESMKNRAKNFETFLASLKVESRRPEMEYFEGEEGIKKAYMKLLESPVKELLHYRPVTMKEEEDPLAPFRVQYFRERYRRGVFSRALAPRTPLGRRFQSRDAFEYRETQLLHEEEFPITFEKIIAGEMVACFNHAEQRACYLKYPELAHTERMMFELLWRRAKEPLTQPQTVALTLPQAGDPVIALSTRSLSSLREFFLSRKSVVIFGIGALLAAGVTYGLWRHTYDLNRERVRERAMAIAATAALQFNADDLNQLQEAADVSKPIYKYVIGQLREIRHQNSGVTYLYILRPTVDQKIFEFVADADSLNPNEKIDLNHDGVIDDADHLSAPGEPIDMSETDWYLQAMDRPLADKNPTSDQWGVWITGSAPIRDEMGNAVAVIGIDYEASSINELSQKSFSPVIVFFAIFALFVLIRLAAFNRSLFFELLHVLRSRTVLAVLGACVLLALLVTYGMYRYTLNLMEEKEGERLMAIVTTASAEIDARDLEPLRFARDMERPEYQRVFDKMIQLRSNNRDVRWVYILRRTNDPEILEFVADADTNFNRPFTDFDYNQDGVIDDADDPAPPGTRYDASGQKLIEEWQRPFYEISRDQWGTFLSGCSPIYDSSGNTVAVLGVDMDISAFHEQVREKFIPYWWFLVIFMVLLALIPIYSWIVSHGKKIRR